MPRSKITGLLLVISSFALFVLFCLFVYNKQGPGVIASLAFDTISSNTYYILSVPFILVTLVVLGTGFWIGFTILTIKVVPPMPELIKKRDFSKPKAFILCMATLALLVFFCYGIYRRSFWAIAIPASVITLVILGAVFWVGFAILTVRKTLPEQTGETNNN